jgi:glutamate dehydrogenase
VKAQMVKNTVIVPVGSKGGFVLKKARRPRATARRCSAEGVACYRTSCAACSTSPTTWCRARWCRRRRGAPRRGRPLPGGRRRQGHGHLLRHANQVSAEYGFWLGDAFASGGSVGYDHKKMGITARGAWEAVKRHFREMGKSTSSPRLHRGRHRRHVGRRVRQRHAAVEAHPAGGGLRPPPHLHRPRSRRGARLAERARMFALPRSSWDDYDRALISPGGGVWPRSAKSITLSPEARAALDIEAETLTPDRADPARS